MAEALNSFVDFIGDFPYQPGWTEDSAIGLPGKDVAALLANGLRERGFGVESVEAIDYGYFLNCQRDRRTFTISVTVDDPWHMRRWNVACPSTTRLWARIIGRSDHAAHRDVLLAIHDVLTTSNRISGLRWFPSFEPPDYLHDWNAHASPLCQAKAAE
jgi:hypothetical protein